MHFILGMGVIIALVYCLWLMISYLWHTFASLQKEVAVSIIAATATILVSVISLIAGKYFERKRIIEQELRNKKIPIYEEFVEFLFKILWSQKKEGTPISEEEMFDFLVNFTQKLIVWGSDDVIKQWSIYRSRQIEAVKEESPNVMFDVENLLLAIRKDTGHKNKGFKKGDLLRLFINDIEKYI